MCYHCGGNHRLSDCRKCTPEQKKKLWEKYSTKFKFNRKFKFRRQSANNTSATTTHKLSTKEQESAPSQTKTNKQAHAQSAITVSSSKSSQPRITFASTAIAHPATALQIPLIVVQTTQRNRTKPKYRSSHNG